MYTYIRYVLSTAHFVEVYILHIPRILYMLYMLYILYMLYVPTVPVALSTYMHCEWEGWRPQKWCVIAV